MSEEAEREKVKMYRSVRSVLALGVLCLILWGLFGCEGFDCRSCGGEGRGLIMKCRDCGGDGKVTFMKSWRSASQRR